MEITGLHILLTYTCTLECEHCFVWGSPRQSGTLMLEQLREIFVQARRLGTVTSIYFEGGEPFLFYPVLLRGVQEAADYGFEVGLVTNAYWATSHEDALEWLRPFAGLVQDLSVSSDRYHWSEKISRQAQNAAAAAAQLGIPLGLISIAPVQDEEAPAVLGQLPEDESRVMYRGRAAAVLAPHAPHSPAGAFTACPHEDLLDPGRLHVDPLGNLHICQGISLGNLFETPLEEIIQSYRPETHPVIGALLAGGPAELARRYEFSPDAGWADACHLCYEVRRALRPRFPAILTPDQVYGG